MRAYLGSARNHPAVYIRRAWRACTGYSAAVTLVVVAFGYLAVR